MEFFRKYVVHNAGLKLLSLGISFSLWAAFAPQPLAEIGYDVPIAFVNVPRDLTLAGDAPAAVHLLVRGRSALMRRVNAADLSFTVDLGRVSRGDTQVRLAAEMADVPYGSSVVGLAPTTVHVSWSDAPAPVSR